MFKKKLALLSALVIAAGMLSALPAAAYADSASEKTAMSEEEKEKSMREALALVKSRIAVPEECTEFDYSASERYSIPTFTFRWYTPEESEEYSYCSVTITGSIITNFSSNGGENGYGRFSPLTEEDITDKALEWIYKVNPEAKGNIEVNYKPHFRLYDSDVDIGFRRTSQGVRVNKNSISVSVDKMTGEMLSYRCNWWDNAKFADVSKAISQKEMQEIYKSEVGMKPWYRLDYDYETKKYTAQAVYVPLDSYVYDALTGKHTSMYDDYDKYQNTDLYYDDDDDIWEEAEMGEAVDGGEGIDDGDVMDFTEAELAALTEQEGLLTADEFRKLLDGDPYIKLTDKYLTQYYDVSKNEYTESGFKVYASFVIDNDKEYKYYSVAADAKTGKVYSFSSYPDSGKKLLDVKAANKLAEEAAKYYYGDVFDHFKPSSDNTSPAVKTEKYTETSRSMTYYRYENNIRVDSDIISIGVNSDGMVTDAYCDFTEDVDFGDRKILSPEAVYDRLFEQQEFDLYFDGFTDLKLRPHTYLHYSFDNWTVNAKTGQLCDYYGNPFTERDEIPERCPYTDIKDSPYKDEIEQLYNYGVYMTTDKNFMPKKVISLSEMSSLFGDVYLYFSVPKEDREKSATNLRVAKLLVDRRGYSGMAEYSEIFRSPYKDIPDDHEDIGYIAIAYTMGILKADKNGNFNPDKAITREQAVHLVYEYVIGSANGNIEE